MKEDLTNPNQKLFIPDIYNILIACDLAVASLMFIRALGFWRVQESATPSMSNNNWYTAFSPSNIAGASS
ncbi:hypothetical protein E2562_029110 [Oryza meyeriana var. granulata]|uniref:Uncharacterized protein n=1 Tax=Oryza meyeriana var. granulata TaxID=110450 RepID=A0A6G1EAS5_9ORYZ|nr:hypothetical protein E2562_029110 [Oryza meyeriana var. granulata]